MLTRTQKLLATAGAALLLLGLVQSPARSAGAPVAKVGYVDLQLTLEKTKAGKAARARLEGEKKKRQTEIDKKQKDLQVSAQELEKKRGVLKPEVVRAEETRLQKSFVELQQQFAGSQQELLKQEASLTREIFKSAAKHIEAIAKRDGYTIIFEKTEGGVLWSDSAFEITEEVNKRMDAGDAGK